MVYSGRFAVTGQIMGACMVTLYHTVDRRSISADEFTIILNNPKSIPWSYLLLCISMEQSNSFFLFMEAEIKSTHVYIRYTNITSSVTSGYPLNINIDSKGKTIRVANHGLLNYNYN